MQLLVSHGLIKTSISELFEGYVALRNVGFFYTQVSQFMVAKCTSHLVRFTKVSYALTICYLLLWTNLHINNVYYQHEGPFHNNKRHGYGGMNTKSDGSKFIGRFSEDKPLEGTYITSEFTYTGSLLEGMAFHGENGCLAERNGHVYKGDFKNGLFHGCGLQQGQCSNNFDFMYKGEFNKGLKHGIGSSSVSLPLLSCIDHKRTYSTYFEEVHCIYKYTGGWKHDVQQGKGSESLILSKKGDESNISITSTYIGNFKNNKRNGVGELTLFDGTVIEGTWNNDIPLLSIPSTQYDLLDDNNSNKSAIWKITFSNGNVYHGEIISNDQQHDIEFKSNTFLHKWNKSEPIIIPHGLGTLSSQGDVYFGNFYKGKRHGEGICVSKQGNQYNGLWHHDQPLHSQCILFPLYHPSLHCVTVDEAHLVDLLIDYNPKDTEDDHSSYILVYSLLSILSTLEKGTLQEERVQQFDLLDNPIVDNQNVCMDATSFNEIIAESRDNTNPKTKDSGRYTPPTISSASSSLSATCDDDLLLNNDDSDLIDKHDLLDILNDDTNDSIDDDDDTTNHIDDVHYVRGMIHHDNKNAIFTMYTRLQE